MRKCILRVVNWLSHMATYRIKNFWFLHLMWGFPGGTTGKEPACQSSLDIKDTGLIPLAWGSQVLNGEAHLVRNKSPQPAACEGAWKWFFSISQIFRVCNSSQQLDCKLLKDPELEPATWPTSGFLISETVWDHKCFLLFIAKFGDNLLCSST